jgi:hypothetical protein
VQSGKVTNPNSISHTSSHDQLNAISFKGWGVYKYFSNISTGIGVGNASASPTGAMLVTVIRECFGRLATITFGHTMGTSIEAECKAYRLLSDVFCDTAMILDCMSPLFPTAIRLIVLCISSTLFAASGVAGNSSKSSLSGHFAKWNNLGELNAVSTFPPSLAHFLFYLALDCQLTFYRKTPAKRLQYPFSA